MFGASLEIQPTFLMRLSQYIGESGMGNDVPFFFYILMGLIGGTSLVAVQVLRTISAQLGRMESLFRHHLEKPQQN